MRAVNLSILFIALCEAHFSQLQTPGVRPQLQQWHPFTPSRTNRGRRIVPPSSLSSEKRSKDVKGESWFQQSLSDRHHIGKLVATSRPTLSVRTGVRAGSIGIRAASTVDMRPMTEDEIQRERQKFEKAWTRNTRNLLTGTWAYGDGKYKYTITNHDGHMFFREAARGHILEGRLIQGEEWFEGVVTNGRIRIKLYDDSGRKAVSNVKKDGDLSWGADVIATKMVPLTGTWFYNDGKSTYSIVDRDGQLFFQEKTLSNTIDEPLVQKEDWLEGQIAGGRIRIKSYDSGGQLAVFNVFMTGDKSWGQDVIATRAAPLTGDSSGQEAALNNGQGSESTFRKAVEKSLGGDMITESNVGIVGEKLQGFEDIYGARKANNLLKAFTDQEAESKARKSVDKSRPEDTSTTSNANQLLVGSWYYNDDKNKYSIINRSGLLVFHEELSGGTFEGPLVQGAEWLEGKITNGHIRIKLFDSSGQKAVSNVRKDGEKAWGGDIVATKKNSHPLVRTWYYGDGRSQYKVLERNGQMIFQEKNMGYTIEGPLVQKSEWFEGRITNGFIRIKLSDSSGKRAVSNVRKVGQKAWGEDLVAFSEFLAARSNFVTRQKNPADEILKQQAEERIRQQEEQRSDTITVSREKEQEKFASEPERLIGKWLYNIGKYNEHEYTIMKRDDGQMVFREEAWGHVFEGTLVQREDWLEGNLTNGLIRIRLYDSSGEKAVSNVRRTGETWGTDIIATRCTKDLLEDESEAHLFDRKAVAKSRSGAFTAASNARTVGEASQDEDTISPKTANNLLTGTWYYDNGKYKYTIMNRDDQLVFREVASGRTFEGALVRRGQWLEGDVENGHIRIKLYDSSGEKAVSNVRKAGEMSWGADLIATKTNNSFITDTSGQKADSSVRTSSELPQGEDMIVTERASGRLTDPSNQKAVPNPLIATWYYNGGKSKYTIMNRDGEMFFHEELAGRKFEISLVQRGEWLEGNVASGQIRIKLYDSSGQKVVSNVRKVGAKSWSHDMIATKSTSNPLTGTWYYNGGKSKYSIIDRDGQLFFHETAQGYKFEGALLQGSEWLEGRITNGFIRIKLSDSSGQNAVSNVRLIGEESWGKDTFATSNVRAAASAVEKRPRESTDDANPFMGTWYYNCGNYKYSILNKNGQMIFHEEASGSTFEGPLVQRGNWLEGSIKNGFIRIKLTDSSGQKAVSNVRTLGEKSWGPDIFATKRSKPTIAKAKHPLTGTWYYNNGTYNYSITNENGQMVFNENTLGYAFEGNLVQGPEWLEGDIPNGRIRVKLYDPSGQKAVSNVKKSGEASWSPDVIATKMADARRLSAVHRGVHCEAIGMHDKGEASQRAGAHAPPGIAAFSQESKRLSSRSGDDQRQASGIWSGVRRQLRWLGFSEVGHRVSPVYAGNNSIELIMPCVFTFSFSLLVLYRFARLRGIRKHARGVQAQLLG